MTEASLKALSMVRSFNYIHWSLAPFFPLLLYVFAVEIKKRNFNILYSCLCFFAFLEVEIINGLVLHFTNYAPLWNVYKTSGFMFTVGINMEIVTLFVLACLGYLKLLPEKEDGKFFGIFPGKWAMIIGATIVCGGTECILNKGGLLIWEYSWWGWQAAFVFYLFMMYVGTTIHYRFTEKQKIIFCIVYGILLGAQMAVFMPLGWI
jgi:hypothetical protein